MVKTACLMWLAVLSTVVFGCATVETVPVSSDDSSRGELEQPSEPDPDRPKELSNTLRWTTASEVENFGFDIYRSTREEGPFEKINPTPIPGAGTTDEPQDYVYVDNTNDPRLGYFYYIESISLQNERERFSPVISIGPKAGASRGGGKEQGSEPR
jgi:hypothetical protein